MKQLQAPVTVVDLMRAWPRGAKAALCAIAFPILGFLFGVVISTLFMNLTEAFTVQGLLAFAFPFSLATWIGLSKRRPWIAAIGSVPPAAFVAIVCVQNHATLGQLLTVWPILFQALVGPGLGACCGCVGYRAILSPSQM